MPNRKFEIDLGELFDVNYGHVYSKLPDEVSIGGVIPHEVMLRAKGARRHGTKASVCCLEAHAASYRAALFDLTSMEEAAKRDLKCLEIPAGKFYLQSSKNPLLIVLKELRNMETHNFTGMVYSDSREFLWGNITEPDKAKSVVFDVHYLSNLEWEQFQQIRNFDCYCPGDLKVAFDWFDEAQKAWGITEMTYRGILIYLEYLQELGRMYAK